MGRIFIVEGVDFAAEWIAQPIRADGHTVVGTAVAAFEAYERVATTAPELAIIDVSSKSGGDTVDLACELRRRFSLFTLFVSGSNDLAQLRRSVRAEPTGYLMAPFDDRQLRANIEVGLARARAEERKEATSLVKGAGERLRVVSSLAGGLERALERPLSPRELAALGEELRASSSSPDPTTLRFADVVSEGLQNASRSLLGAPRFVFSIESEDVFVAADGTKLARAIGVLVASVWRAHDPKPGTEARVLLGRDDRGRATLHIEMTDNLGHAKEGAHKKSLVPEFALAMAESVIGAHGGVLEHEVDPRHTSVRLTLPRVAPAVASGNGQRALGDPKAA